MSIVKLILADSDIESASNPSFVSDGQRDADKKTEFKVIKNARYDQQFTTKQSSSENRQMKQEKNLDQFQEDFATSIEIYEEEFKFQ